MAIAGKSGRSLGGEAAVAELQVPPPFIDVMTWTRSFGPGCTSLGVGPCDQASTISSVAPTPVGAPFAMSTDGNEPSRAPAWPSKVASPVKSWIPVDTMCVTTFGGRVKCLPPSDETVMKIAAVRVFGSMPSQNTYTL